MIWRKRAGGGNDSKFIAVEHENIIVFSKNISNLKMNTLERENLNKYKQDLKGFYLEKPLNDTALQDSPGLHYDIKLPNGKILKGNEHQWKMSQKTFNEKNDNKEIIYKSNDKVYYKHYIDINSGILPTSIFYNLVLNSSGTKEIKELFSSKVFATPKPEALIKRIIEISTQENDLVMDFFAGSGTTLAVAMKMKRRFIGIEQMDYIESITKERLKKVINGEQGGISKAVDWQGGGSFIYCELMPLNAVYKEKLLSLRGEAQAFHNQKVDSSVDCHEVVPTSRNDKEVEKELEKIYNDLESKAFVDYRVDIQAMLQDKEFHALSLDEKLKVLYAILDSNMDYVLYDDIDDSEYGVSEELRELNRIFYGEEE